ncbi:MAG: amino acid adenylation domain-containing protein [Acidobacteriota bacterium]
MSTQVKDRAQLTATEKRALLRRLLAAEAARPQRHPCSFAQQRLWFLDQLEPGNSAYHLPLPLRLEGQLNFTAFAASLDEVVRRHAALRTTFEVEDGLPVQVVARSLSLSAPVVDLRQLPEDERAATVDALLQAEIRRPFDLVRGPLLRVLVLSTGDREHVVFLSMHHIVSDGWSMGILMRELATLYRAFAAGQPSPLPPLPIQYADFAVWQRDWLASHVMEQQLDYWQRTLGAGTPALALAADRSQAAQPIHTSGRLSRRLPNALSEQLLHAARRHDVTLFMLLLAVFKILLCRLSGQSVVTVGSPIANRNRPEIEGLIGFFVNTLVFRTELDEDLSFRQLLRRVRENSLAAHAHQDLPFERLVEALAPTRDLARTPLFQVMLNMLNFTEQSFELPGLRVEAIAFPELESKFDLTLYSFEVDRQIRLRLVYNAHLFSPDRAAEMLGQLEHLLAQVVADSERPISQMSLATPAARKRLPDPSRSRIAARPAESVLSRFARQVRRAPRQLAAVDAHESLNYAELAVAADGVAATLAAAGLGAGDLVAVYAPRRVALVWSVLGVLRADAAFLILDPAYPPAYLAGRLRAAKPRGFLQLGPTHRPDEVAACLAEVGCVCFDFATPPAAPTSPPAARNEGLAYLAFTSGSTGKPKGVLGEHLPIAHFLDWYCATFQVSESDRFAMLSGLGHDPLLRDLFAPLSLGATLVVPDPERIGEPGWLARWLRQEGVTVCHLTPAMGQLLTTGDQEALIPNLRYLFFGGDRLLHTDLARIRRAAPGAAVVNFFGATETPQAVASQVVLEGGQPVAATSPSVVPLGRGVGGSQLLVLRRGGHLAGIGEVGELHVRSSYLARGYLDDPTLTATRFVPDLAGSPGSRSYRTGDLGRFLPDGSAELAGRADRQIKIRGFRIEPAEVEARLAEHPLVDEARVELRDDAPGGHGLVAYVRAPSEVPNAAELRQHLSSLVPGYMVPVAYVVLESWPLDPRGKVDRSALPPPTGAAATTVDSPPRTPLEELLAGIWGELLGRSNISIGDSFFDLGGHSLLATQLVSRVRDALGVELPLRALFKQPTLEGLAAAIESHRGSDQAAPPIEPGPRGDRVPLSFAQQRLWFLQQLDPASPVFNIADAVELKGQLDVAAMALAVQGVVQRHESLRTTFAEVDGDAVQRIATVPRTSLPLVDLEGLAQEDKLPHARRLAAQHLLRAMDLGCGPLLHTLLVRLGDAHHLAFFAVHHIVADGWSMGILVREIAAGYGATLAGQAAASAPLPLQYADYAIWQRHWLSGQALERLLAYWRQQLAGPLPVLELPMQRRRRRPGQSFAGALERLTLPAELSAEVHRLGRQEGTTLFMTLLAAFQTLLHLYTGEHDLLVGTNIANRQRRELEGLIGFFVNTLVMRTDLSGAPSFRQLLARVRQTTLDAYDHQDVPFEKVIEEVRPDRAAGAAPLFQTKLVLQNLPAAQQELPGLTLAPLELEQQTTNFDLTLFATDRPSGLIVSLVYATELFEGPSMAELLKCYRAVLEAAVDDPDRSISSFGQLLGPSENAPVDDLLDDLEDA